MLEQPGLQIEALRSMAFYAIAVLTLAAVMIFLSHLLGEKNRERTTTEPYESGLLPTGSAWTRFHVNYYLFAVFFVILDLESIFVFAWAVTVREAGWRGYFVIAAFIGVLLVALFYLWRTGALAGTRPRTHPRGGETG